MVVNTRKHEANENIIFVTTGIPIFPTFCDHPLTQAGQRKEHLWRKS